MKIINYSERSPSLINQYIAQLRDINEQSSRRIFRQNLTRLGQIMAYELSKELDYQDVEVQSPLGSLDVPMLSDHVVLAAILRAGLTLHAGMLDFFEEADNAFISAYRRHHKDGSFEIELEYVTCPDIKDRVVVLIDPMVATGSSIESAWEALRPYGQPRALHIVCAIAARPGVDRLSRLFPDATMWVGAIDDELTAKAFIVPGLGDAGDLSYGQKSQF